MRTEEETKRLALVLGLWTLKNVENDSLRETMSVPEKRTEFLDTICKTVVDGGLEVDMDVFRTMFCNTIENNLKR